MSVSQSLMSPWVQPLTNIWLQGEKQQATTLASLAVLQLKTTKQGLFRIMAHKSEEGGRLSKPDSNGFLTFISDRTGGFQQNKQM